MFRRILCSLSFATLVAALPGSMTHLLADALPGADAPAEAMQQPPSGPGADLAQTAQPPLTFRVEANFVEVDAFVSDAMGNPVTDLRAADFQLFEDGKPQKVSAFAQVNIPVARAERPLFSPSAIEPDVQTNVGLDGRIYLFVLDDLHVDLTRAPRVKESLHRFFERNFGANDLAAVVFTSGRAADGQDFTNSPRLLLAAVDKFIGRKLRSPTLERLDEYNRLQTGGLRQAGGPVNDPLAMERGRDARNTMQSLGKLSDFMAGVHGRRKAMVLVSEGVDYDIYNLFDNNSVASDIVDATRDAIAAATRGNISIYAVDPRGLATPGSELIETSGVVGNDPSLRLGVVSSLDELRLSQDSLRSLADETGGFAITNQNDFNDAFDRIVGDNSSYYVIGYYATNDRRDGKFRKIDVRLTRPGLTVRARRGYVAPRGRAAAPPKAANDPLEDALRAAVESPVGTGGVPMRLFTAPYKGTPPNAAVALAVELGIGGFTFTQQNGTYNDKINVVIRVLDSDGKVRVNDKTALDLTLMPDTFTRARSRGFRVTSGLNLPPGRYQLRVSAADSAGNAGTVMGNLEVPDFYKPPMAMSGLTLTSASATLTPTARAKDDPVGLLLMRPPTTSREFTRDDRIMLFAEVYENQRNLPPHTVDIATEVRADGGRVVFSDSEERSSTELQGASAGAGSANRGVPAEAGGANRGVPAEAGGANRGLPAEGGGANRGLPAEARSANRGLPAEARSAKAGGGFGYTVDIPLKDFAPGLYVVHVTGTSRGGKDGTGVSRDIQIRIR